MERTVIVVRRPLTVPKAIFAGSIPDKSFAKFKASMAIFKVERIVFHSFCGRDFASIFENRGNCEGTCGAQGCEEEPES